MANYDEKYDLTKQILQRHSDTARSAAKGVYKRLPDAMEIEVVVFSPVLEVPIEGVGMSTISLGNLRLATPSPCAYTDISLDLRDLGVLQKH